MPVRDMDMYATWQRQQSHSQASTSNNTNTPTTSNSQGALDEGVGVPVGSNRGASGIDGVLSTAAGFAAGLKRSVTLTVGDVSFLHDINGLNLLRTGVGHCKHCHTLQDVLFYSNVTVLYHFLSASPDPVAPHLLFLLLRPSLIRAAVQMQATK